MLTSRIDQGVRLGDRFHGADGNLPQAFGLARTAANQAQLSRSAGGARRISAGFPVCLTVIPPAAPSLEHLAKLRHWVEPLGLSASRLSLHAIESERPVDVSVEIARYNSVDLLVLGAPSEVRRAWAHSTASAVTAKVTCDVYVVRPPRLTHAAAKN